MTSPAHALSKTLPHSIDAERAILGAILLDNAALDKAAEHLTGGDFFHANHRLVFNVMQALREAGKPIDLVALVHRLADAKQLEAAGGAAYISELMDGVPHVSNVGHYANIVKEKSMLRGIIRGTEAIQQRAFDGLSTPHEIAEDLDTLYRLSSNGHGHTRPRPISLAEFLGRSLDPVTFKIDPIFPAQGLAMIYAWRGTGKTFFNLELAAGISTGGKCLKWNVPEPSPVLYVDGEMAANDLQDRFKQILIGRGITRPPQAKFEIFTPDILDADYPNTRLDIVTRQGQKMIEDHLTEGTFLILDNLSSLGHVEGTGESESESWWPIQDWALRLRRKRVTVLFNHHAGKSGVQRGTSAREDAMNTVIEMRRPGDYHQHQGLRAEIHFQKVRRFEGSMGLEPFELSLSMNDRGGATWLIKDLTDLTKDRVRDMLREGMSVREIADDLALSRFQVHRIKRKIEDAALHGSE